MSNKNHHFPLNFKSGFNEIYFYNYRGPFATIENYEKFFPINFVRLGILSNLIACITLYKLW